MYRPFWACKILPSKPVRTPAYSLEGISQLPDRQSQGQIDTKAILTDMGLYEQYMFVRSDGRTLRNMSGYNRLVRREWQTRKGGSPGGHPFDKFYLSLDLTSEERIAQGGQLFIVA